MPLHTVAALLVEPVSMFEYALAHEVFGLDRTAYGVPAVEFFACAEAPRGRAADDRHRSGPYHPLARPRAAADR